MKHLRMELWNPKNPEGDTTSPSPASLSLIHSLELLFWTAKLAVGKNIWRQPLKAKMESELEIDGVSPFSMKG